ncbi:LacI family transcriptional regulator [Agromyces sp. SYSU K20354]|uniref:LacI family DNA-binding transcriptional regulator n=1 Tax=Agromyces cavernae TaxID=2898659 RepID=UPI001E52B9F1|nr:LacI family DNA-binding transcriptional regulator [Agromyces cavernae]MCD2444099.1 LacI family transcriptional regulator [Agromyces cavernae]
MAEDHDAPHATNPTIYDVARVSGVAPSTVSRTFSRPGRVNVETADRIRRVAAELGYRTKPVTRALSTARTRLFAVIVPDVPDRFFREVIRGATEAANAAGYTVVVVDAQRSAESERAALDRLLPVVDGVIFAASLLPDATIRVAAKQRPTVVLNRAMADVASVLTDSADGMRQSVEHLAALGHRELTYIAGPAASWADGIRWRSFKVATHRLGLRARRVGPTQPTPAGGVAAAQAFARQPTSGVIAFNDFIAAGFIRGLAEAGLRVPEDVSVVGFDNLAGRFGGPPLTTVAAPLPHLGSHAVRILLQQLSGAQAGLAEPGGTVRPTRLPALLVVRTSTAAPTSRDSNAVPPAPDRAA